MNIALSTVSLMDLAWRDCFAQAAQAGYRNIEVLMIPGWSNVPQLGKDDPAELAAEAARHGLAVVSLHAGALDGTTEAAAQETTDHLKRLVAFARAANVPLVNANGGHIPDGYGRDARRKGLERMAAAARAVEPLLAQHGPRLTLENHFGYQLETVADYDEFFALLPGSGRIGITVDTGHFTAARVDMPAFIARFGPKVFHVHVKDHVGHRSVPLGEGETDNAAVVAALAGQGYDGTLSVELEVRDGREVEYVRRALPYMENLLRGVHPRDSRLTGRASQ